MEKSIFIISQVLLSLLMIVLLYMLVSAFVTHKRHKTNDNQPVPVAIQNAVALRI